MLPDRSQIVIIGGGIAGASIAYHLAELGKRDVIVLEQSDLVSGTTSHAPGLVGQLRSDETLTTMLRHSVSLYRRLRLDDAPGFFEVGSLRIASSKMRLEEIKKQALFAKKVGLEASLLTQKEAADMFPLMSLAGVEGALFLPSDGSATAPLLARAMIEEARDKGVTFFDNTKVIGIDVKDSQIKGVKTQNGYIETETLVIAVGIWSPLIAKLCDVALPLIPMQHQYAVSGQIKELADCTIPNLRDPDNLVYFRQNEQCFTFGGYERNPIPFPSINIPDRKDPTVQTFDEKQFEPLLRAAEGRVPLIKGSALTKQVNGLESFTPDGEFILGPAGGINGLWTACGFCAHGVSGAGGVGKVLAEWIVDGKPSLDVKHMDPNRFGASASDQSFIERNAFEVYSTYYDMKEAVVLPGY